MQRYYSQSFCVVGSLIEKNGKIALVKESVRNNPDDGKWNQPAGWLDVGENPIVGVKRETEEETGFIFTPTAILGIYSLVRKDLEKKSNGKGTPHAIKIIFIGETNTDSPKKFYDDIVDLKWFKPEEIHAMDSSTLRDADIKQLVKDYFAGKKYPLELVNHFTQE